jgi:hypothetical protein
MSKLRRPRGMTPKQIEKNFQPYAAALGTVVYSWNKLHQNLAYLFWGVIGTASGTVPLTVWHSTDNDRAQRQLLRKVAEAKSMNALEKFKNPKTVEDIKWLLDRADSLADQRNDAIHAPYLFIIGPGPMKLEADDFLGHSRAKKLKGKNLLDELKWCHQTAAALPFFAHLLYMAVLGLQMPWPDRPRLPPRPAQNQPRSGPPNSK